MLYIWLPGFRLWTDALCSWTRKVWLYQPGGAPSGTYRNRITLYDVTVKLHKLYLWAYTAVGWYDLGIGLGSVGQASFRMNSPARRALRRRMRTIGTYKMLAKFASNWGAGKVIERQLENRGYIREEKYWMALRFRIKVTRRGTRIGS